MNLFFEKGKRAILLLHAYTGTPNDVRMLARALEVEDYTVFAPTFAGHGRNNPQNILDNHPEIWRQNVDEAISFLKNQGYQEVAVFGLSMGGVFALDALTRYGNDLIAGGAFCSPIKLDTWHTISASFSRYYQSLLKKQHLEQERIVQQVDTIQPQLEQQLESLGLLGEEVYQKLPEVQQNVFLAQAGRDELINPKTVYQTATQLTQTEVELHYYPESTHVITVGKDHKKLERAVSSFLQTLPWSGK